MTRVHVVQCNGRRALGRVASAMLVAALVVAGACARHGGAAPASQAAPLQPLPEMARLYYDNSGGIQDSVRLVVRDPASLAQVWQRATSGQASPPPEPAIDFAREMVLVAGAGRMTPTDQVQVDSVGVRRQTNAQGKTQDVLTAWISITQGCQRFQTDAFPLEIVRVRRFEGPVNFVAQHVRAAGCR